MIARLAWRSLRHRKVTVGLTVLSIALAVMLLLGVERIRQETRANFAATLSGTDLIVGARSSPVHLLLSTVFRIGNPANNIRWSSYEAIAGRPEVAWTIPMALGDSHRGFRVVGTTAAFFDHFRYAGGRRLVVAAGTPLASDRDVVLGSEVARDLGYTPGARVVIAHGAGDVSFMTHDERPFVVSGVLAPTGTPVDRGLYVTLAALEAVHAPAIGMPAEDPLESALHRFDTDASDRAGHPHALTAFLVGLRNRGAALGLQRVVNEYADEPLTAILPGVTMQELWEVVGVAERALVAVSALAVAVGLGGMLVALLTSLNERRREMAILRAVGARPVHVFGLMLGEGALVTALGVLVGATVLHVTLFVARDTLAARFGVVLSAGMPSAAELRLVAIVLASGVAIGLLPAYRVFRYTVSDGMTIRT